MIQVRAKTTAGESWQPKTKRNRDVSVSATLRTYLDRQTARASDHRWLFPSPEGNRQLKLKINQYIKSVWRDYDQEVNVVLETDRVIVQFYDPSHESPGFYEMQERSQGAQSFLSFLLTIGAEAEHGVISNTVLLLDEPETHLHPSGVRYMRNELIKAATRGNIVVFATHSVFMIDEDDYSRHLLVKKANEKTAVQPSTRDRVGYFMQEEVLYGALDIKLADTLPFRNRFNFVLEGDADVYLFDAAYRNCTPETSRPFGVKPISIYQGGKCSDIRNYFKHKPIQLGTTWVFLLDNDKPAKDLAKALESTYRPYLDQAIFIFHYERADRTTVELEDLLPTDILRSAATAAASECGVAFSATTIQNDETFASVSKKLADFEGVFKKHLNAQILLKASELDTQEKLAQLFPHYAVWLSKVLGKLKDSSHSRTGSEPKTTQSPKKA